MKPYSQDLREKIVRALEGDNTQEEVADRFSVSLSFIEKLWRRFRTTGSCSALPHAGGRRRTLRKHEAALRKEVAAQPDITLEELGERVQAAGAPSVCLATMCAELRRLDLPRKKSRSTTASKTRRAFEGCARGGGSGRQSSPSSG
ncbi:MAG: IS630 transposase-related protein [Acidobacteria bacterium]|nr:IS630 transposase-related protein [Acidobacteriota bacterium]